jgi:hypothetical protein
MHNIRLLRALAAILAALLAASCSAAEPAPTATPSQSPTASCDALVLPYGTTSPIGKVVDAVVVVRAGLRLTPPDDSGHAGPTMAIAAPGVEVRVCGKYTRPRDGKTTWKGVVLLSPSDSRIGWLPPYRRETTAWVEARKLRAVPTPTPVPA